MVHQSSASARSLPGYIIEERIGGGGYGEVWKALAPGSLHKAIKFVYGYHDEDRAARELKALERIKEVRHPFLLTIERIEIHEGQLVIVTELADMSLRDRFNDCRQSGLTGIPRDELLQHLRDAADALDYMSERKNLQHLDVKPENLLMIGGRVKVADFGLVRDVQEVTGSLMSGLTPVYAPPELFDGRPTHRSDQYSLAIVFQEMLTGVRPFRGSTAAQLTSQHLNDSPDLDSLPPSDRPNVARALAKDPELRFGCCRELVDRLLRANMPYGQPSAPAGDTNVGSNDLGPGNTMVESPVRIKRDEFEPVSGDTGGTTSTLRRLPARIINLPRVELPTDEPWRLRPTLFLGIGGTGARTLRHLRRRLTDRFGRVANVPAFRMLCIDTDLKSILRASQGDEEVALDAGDTLAMPLRRTQDYRTEKTKLLRWLSRRWIYNIPRSLQTEGRRPLGRIALVDHAEDLFERLRTIVSEMVNADALGRSREAAGCELSDDAPRVVLVASISGGTGGGMVLDVPYIVRHAFACKGVPVAGVHAILAHSTARASDARDLAIVNAYATLSELNYYSRPGTCYPGEEDCGLPASGGEDVTFRSANFVHLGDGLTEQQLDDATDQLAEYLYLDTTTECGTFLERLQQTAQSVAPLDPAIVPLRTFGLHTLGGARTEILDTITNTICYRLFDLWLGAPSHATATSRGANGDGGTSIDEHTLHLLQLRADELAFDTIVAGVRDLAAQQLGGNHEAMFAELVSRHASESAEPINPPTDDAPASEQAEFVDRLLGAPLGSQADAGRATAGLVAALDTHARRLATERGQALGQWVLQLADDGSTGIRGAARAVAWLQDCVRSLDRDAAERVRSAEQFAKRLCTSGVESPARDRGKVRFGRAAAARDETAVKASDDLLHMYFHARLDQLLATAARRVLRSIGGEISQTADKLSRMARNVSIMRDRFPEPATGMDAAPTVPSATEYDAQLTRSLWTLLSNQVTDLTQQLDQRMRQHWFDEQTGLAAFAEDGNEAINELPSRLRSEARAAVIDATNDLNMTEMVAALTDGDEGAAALRDCLNRIVPRPLVFGGAKTLMLAAQEGADVEQLQTLIEQEAQADCNTVHHSDASVVLGCLGEQLSLAAVAGGLIEHRPTYAEVAGRLHTRIDVDWTPIG